MLNNSKEFIGYLDLILGLFLLFITFKYVESFEDLKFLLWSCDIMALLLSINLIFLKSYKIYFFVFLVTFSSTIEWIIDYFKMKLGFEAPKTEWMLNTDEPLIYTELQHAIIMVIPLYYAFFYLKRGLRKKDWIIFFFLVSIYYLILAFLSYYLTLFGFYDYAENINCVIRDCGYEEGFRDLKGLILYWLHYVKNLALLLFFLFISFNFKYFFRKLNNKFF